MGTKFCSLFRLLFAFSIYSSFLFVYIRMQIWNIFLSNRYIMIKRFHAVTMFFCFRSNINHVWNLGQNRNLVFSFCVFFFRIDSFNFIFIFYYVFYDILYSSYFMLT